jgi:flagellar assembly protein FliH
MGNSSNKSGRPEQHAVEKWVLPSVGSIPAIGHRGGARQVSSRGEQGASSTPQDLEKWRKQAEAQGYQQGMAKAEAELAGLRQQVLDIINFFENPLQGLNEEVEQELSHLAVILAQQLVRREIRADPGELIGVIREGVKMLPAHSRRIRIVLNPEDAELVRSTLQLDEHDEDLHWKLVEDPMISRGGCEIKADHSVINATLENRLQALAASVLGGDRQEDREDGPAESD